MIRKIKSVAIALALLVGSTQATDKTDNRARSSVKIGGCSSTIIARGPEVAYGVSAAHCASKVGEMFSFTTIEGTTGTARWKLIDRDADLALYICWSKEVLSSAPVTRVLVKGPSGGFGFTGARDLHQKALTFVRSEEISNLKGMRFLFSVDKGAFSGGDSGGGVFYGPNLVSVMSHGVDNKWAMGSTHQQLVEFLSAYESTAKMPLVVPAPEGSQPVAPKKFEPKLGSDVGRAKAIQYLLKQVAELEARKPEPPPVVDTKRIDELERLVVEQKKQLDLIRSTPSRVQVLDPRTGKVEAEQAYPFGTPVKLVLPQQGSKTKE